MERRKFISEAATCLKQEPGQIGSVAVARCPEHHRTIQNLRSTFLLSDPADDESPGDTGQICIRCSFFGHLNLSQFIHLFQCTLLSVFSTGCCGPADASGASAVVSRSNTVRIRYPNEMFAAKNFHFTSVHICAHEKGMRSVEPFEFRPLHGLHWGCIGLHHVASLVCM